MAAESTDAGPVLLFGASGQVGRELLTILAEHGPVIALDRKAVELADVDAIRDAVRRARPRIIVNAAAYTAVDSAEREPALAHAVNAIAPGVMAEEAQALGACMVHYSTDYVFDGRKDAPYVEEDGAAPLSVYGRSKRAGEQAVATACARHLVIRTSWVFSPHGASSFPWTMLRLAAEREQLRVVADQTGAPTSASLVAHVTTGMLLAMRLAPADDPRWGTYHLAAVGETTWHAYARRIISAGHRAGMPLKTTAADVVPISSAEYPVEAARPSNSRLDTGKLRRTFGITLPDWTHDVDDVLALLTQPPPAIR